jgi:hypothetical protein
MMTNYEVMELICDSLSDARSAIEDCGIWLPLVHLCHPEGVQSMVIPAPPSGPGHETEAADPINRLRKELNAYLVIMLSDNWIAEMIPGTNPYAALVVTIWGSDGLPTYGTQKYRRCVGGQVLFDEFLWGVHFQFARPPMDSAGIRERLSGPA